MELKAREVVVEMVEQYGVDAWQEPRKCEALLRDLLALYRRESSVLIAAVREGVPVRLAASLHEKTSSIAGGVLARMLEDNLALSSEAANWAVETWSIALGIPFSPGRSKDLLVEPFAAIPASLRPAFVTVSAGRHWIGSPDNEPDRSSRETRHEVVLTRHFEIQTTPVTQAQYAGLLNDNPAHFVGLDRPVETVSWFDAVNFCNAASRSAGLTEAYAVDGNEVVWNREADGFRLPTEAEWEVACRAGTEGACYGDQDEVGWYSNNSGRETHPVARKKPNAWGLYDMLGNVWEWCWDWHDDYPSGLATDPLGPDVGSRRVLRGDAWNGDVWNGSARNARAASRYSDAPDSRLRSLGFRLVRFVF